MEKEALTQHLAGRPLTGLGRLDGTRRPSALGVVVTHADAAPGLRQAPSDHRGDRLPAGECLLRQFQHAAAARRCVHRWRRGQRAGAVTSWLELTTIAEPLVSFGWTWVFAQDAGTLTSDSTLRFRHRVEVLADLHPTGYDTVEVRDAPDRPGREFVFLARKTRDTPRTR